MQSYRVSDGIVERLRDYGIHYFFGVSGANIEPIHDSIHLYGQGLLHSVLAKHESGAGFMADAHARIYRTLGVCGSTSGGGMLNLLTAVAEANVSSVPLLALVGQPPTHLWGKGAFQDSSGFGRAPDAVGLFAAVSKFTRLVTRSSDALGVLDDAISVATSGRPGASVILLPRDVLLEPIPRSFEQIRNSSSISVYPSPAPALVEAVADAMITAKRPLLVAGQGLQRSPRGQRQVLEFAEAFTIPVVVSLSGKGSFPNRHHLFGGVLSASGDQRAIHLLGESDLVIVVGAGLNVMTREPVKDLLKNKRIAYINIEEDYIDNIVPAALKLTGDAGECLSALRSAINFRAADRPESMGHNSDKTGWQAKLVFPSRETASPDLQDARLTMREAVETIRPLIPIHANLLIDAGNAGATGCHLLPCPDDGAFVTALGMGGMGWAVAGSVGAAMSPIPGETRLTVVIAGDGALLMNGSEINTIVSNHLPVILVVLNNASHGMCVTRQKLYFNGRLEAVEYPQVDLAGYAKSLAGDSGILAKEVRTSEELHNAFIEVLERRGPALLDVQVTQYEIPPFAPFLHAAQMVRKERALQSA